MTQSNIETTKQRILNELDVLEDDIHVTNDEDAMTFYVPIDQLDQARESLDTEVEVLEEHEHEYLVKINL
jgi:chaperonin cofactor prefoldin